MPGETRSILSFGQVASSVPGCRFQKNHLIPLQVVRDLNWPEMFGCKPERHRCFADFRRNGVLLSADEVTARRTRLPLHRGPHPRYSDIVAQRVACIARQTAATGQGDPIDFRLSCLQRGLRRGLLDIASPTFQVHRRDPLRATVNFDAIDRAIDRLWSVSGTVEN